MITRDRGLAALAEAIHQFEDPHFASPSPKQRKLAAAILGERGVFLPDGIPDAWINARDLVDAQAEIARLRKIEAAARGVESEIDIHGVCICEPPYPRGSRHHPQCDDDPGLVVAVDALRAALEGSEGPTLVPPARQCPQCMRGLGTHAHAASEGSEP